MKWILAIIATEAITEILLHSDLFGKVRGFLSKFWFFNELFVCGWCLSFWVAIFVFILILKNLEIILIPIVIHRLSNYFHYCYGILRNFRWRE